MSSKKTSWRLWKGSEDEQLAAVSMEPSYLDDPEEKGSETFLPPRPIYIEVDEKNNPTQVEVSGTVQAVHIFPYTTSLFLTDGKILECKTKNFQREIKNGSLVVALGTPIFVEENPKGFLFVNCKINST